jgi:hypothetical protein
VLFKVSRDFENYPRVTAEDPSDHDELVWAASVMKASLQDPHAVSVVIVVRAPLGSRLGARDVPHRSRTSSRQSALPGREHVASSLSFLHSAKRNISLGNRYRGSRHLRGHR